MPPVTYSDAMLNNIMKKISNTILSLFIMVFQVVSYAGGYSHDEILAIDEPIPETVNLEFSDTNGLLPRLGEFEVMSFILMSNSSGERWATVTLKNNSSHQRILDSEHITAVFADGEIRNPIRANHKFSSHEVVTMVINFGKSKFPVLRVSVRNYN